MAAKGTYNHLDRDCPVKINDGGEITAVVSMRTLVDAVVTQNYGVDRFLSRLIDSMRELEIDGEKLGLADGIEQLLNSSENRS